MGSRQKIERNLGSGLSLGPFLFKSIICRAHNGSCAPLVGQPAQHVCIVCCATHNFRFERDFEHFALSFRFIS